MQMKLVELCTLSTDCAAVDPEGHASVFWWNTERSSILVGSRVS